MFTGTGTIGMESSVVSLVSHGDRTLTLMHGYFGRRMLLLNQVHGAKAECSSTRTAVHADPDDLRKQLRKLKYKVVFITHVDTSTSVVNPVRELVEECGKAGVFSVVDSRLRHRRGAARLRQARRRHRVHSLAEGARRAAPGRCCLPPPTCDRVHGEARETHRVVLHEPPQMEAGDGRPKDVSGDPGDPGPSGTQGGADLR